VLHLMVETLRQAGVTDIYLDLGHVGVYRGLVAQAGLDADQEAILFDALQRKAKPEIADILSEWSLNKTVVGMLTALADLNGDDSVLTKACAVLQQANQSVRDALDNLQQIASVLQQRLPDLKLHYDLAELRGYHYHTGAVFAAYVPGRGQAIAQGGRYDGIGRAFGQSRPATGFSTDLRTLAMLTQESFGRKLGIMAPVDGDASLHVAIEKLRAAGERVVIELPGQQGDAKALGCDRRLVKYKKDWEVKSV
jgi:ATP phosphoribosyltransferase regulatory subunit